MKRVQPPGGSPKTSMPPPERKGIRPAPLNVLSNEGAKPMQIQHRSVRDHYEVLNTLGRSRFCLVKKARNIETKEIVALKILDKRKEGVENAYHQARREVGIMSNLKHLNIVQLIAVYESDRHFVLVLEAMEGGELFDRVIAKTQFSEFEASQALRQVIQSVAWLHGQGIVHRDLKPENLLYKTLEESSPLKIADFGLSRRLSNPMDSMKTPCGTASYVAPEVLQKEGGYDRAVDMWSIGVIAYTLLCGFPPFMEDSPEALYEEIRKGAYEFIPPYWDDISDQAKNFVHKLLVVEPKKRMSAVEALAHPWLCAHDRSRSLMLPSPGIMRGGLWPEHGRGMQTAQAVGAAIDVQRGEEGTVVEVKLPQTSKLWKRRQDSGET